MIEIKLMFRQRTCITYDISVSYVDEHHVSREKPATNLTLYHNIGLCKSPA